jgi:hypothetical protein
MGGAAGKSVFTHILTRHPITTQEFHTIRIDQEGWGSHHCPFNNYCYLDVNTGVNTSVNIKVLVQRCKYEEGVHKKCLHTLWLQMVTQLD